MNDRQISVAVWFGLWWYGHVLRKEDTDWVKKCMEYEVDGSRPRGRPKRTWKEVVQKDCQARNLNKEDAMKMEEADKDWMMIRMVGGWVFLLVLAHPGSPGQRAVKWLLLLLFCCVQYSSMKQEWILVSNSHYKWCAILPSKLSSWTRQDSVHQVIVPDWCQCSEFSSVPWYRWLGVRKSIRPVKIEWWDEELAWSANDLHVV